VPHVLDKKLEHTLDSKDRRLLFESNLDAIETDSVLARRCGLSQSVFTYRLRRLIELKIVRGFTLIPNLSDFGLTAYGVYCRASSSTEKELSKFFHSLEKENAIYWTTRLAGEFDLLVAFASPEPKSFLEKLNNVFDGRFSNSEMSIAMRVKVTQYQRRYLVAKSKNHRSITFETGGKQRQISQIDREIIENFSENSRMTYSECAKHIGLDRTTVKRRFDSLKKSGIVKGVISLIDCAAFGYQGYILLLHLTSYGELERGKLKNLADQSLYANELIETIGPWQAEFHVEVPDQLALQQILSAIRLSLGNSVREIRVVLNVEYYKKYKFPIG